MRLWQQLPAWRPIPIVILCREWKLWRKVRESEAERRIKQLEESLEKQTQEIKRLIRQQANRSGSGNPGNRRDPVRTASEHYGGRQPNPPAQCVNPVYVPSENFSGVSSAGSGNYQPRAHVSAASSDKPPYDGWRHVRPQCDQAVVNNPEAVQPPLSAFGQPAIQYFMSGNYGQRPAMSSGRWYSNSGRGSRSFRASSGEKIPYNTCAKCLKPGHWKAECSMASY